MNAKKESDDVFVDGIENLIADDKLGVRWKEGSYDRVIRGQKKLKEVDVPDYCIPTGSIAQREVQEYVHRNLKTLEYLLGMRIKNSVLTRSLVENDILCYKSIMENVVDIDISEIEEADFTFFFDWMRDLFLAKFAIITTGLVTVKRYAEFTGAKENTIRKWMERKKVELVDICGVSFIVIKREELLQWNQFLMEEALRKEQFNEFEREELEYLYKKMYLKDQEQVPVPVESVLAWSKYVGIHQENKDESMSLHRFKTQLAYNSYCDFCFVSKITPVSVKFFTNRITSLGFRRFNGRKRGFFYYKEDE